jgi:Flp pilus assembly protein TadD
MRMGLVMHQTGRIEQAEEIYREILRQAPEQADALHYLGVLSHQNGRTAEAIDLIRRARSTTAERTPPRRRSKSSSQRD